MMNFDLSDVVWTGKVFVPDPEPDPMKLPVTKGPSTARWVRFPDETEWHVQTGPVHGPRIARCTGYLHLPVDGEAVLSLGYGGVFGPACPVCAKLEGCLDPS